MSAKPATKNVLLRLDPAMAERLEAVAEVEGRSVSDVIREAISELITRKRADKKFRKAVGEAIERNKRLLDLLAEDER